jgi:hypothetical protein
MPGLTGSTGKGELAMSSTTRPAADGPDEPIVDQAGPRDGGDPLTDGVRDAGCPPIGADDVPGSEPGRGEPGRGEPPGIRMTIG